MSNTISVPEGFKQDYELVCARLAMSDNERDTLRDKIRSDFDDWGVVVQRVAAIWRYVDKVWSPTLGVGVMPSREQSLVMLAAMRWWPADLGLLGTLTELELVELCGQVDGSIPGPIAYQKAYFTSMSDLLRYREQEAAGAACSRQSL